MNAASKRTSERRFASIERRLAPPEALGLLTIVCATHVAVPQTASVQLRGCDVKDARCLDETYSSPCAANVAPWPDTCEALLAELAAFPGADSEPEILSNAAFAHHMLADAAESDEDAAVRKQTARNLYRRAVALDPSHTGAYVGLANLAEDLAERIDWLREALRTSDSIPSIPAQSLSTALRQLGTREAALEAAAVMRAAYEAQPRNRHKWYLGASTLFHYTRLGLESEADELQEQARDEIGVDRLLGTVARTTEDSEAALESMDTLCDNYVTTLLGAGSCIDGVELLFEAARATSDVTLSRRLVQQGLTHMEAIPITASGRVDRPAEIVGWLEELGG